MHHVGIIQIEIGIGIEIERFNAISSRMLQDALAASLSGIVFLARSLCVLEHAVTAGRVGRVSTAHPV